MCPNCGQSVPARWDVCQSCGKRVVSHTAIRVWGMVYFILGAGISATMIYLGIYIGNIMAHSSDPGSKIRFNGTPTMAVGIFALFGVICLFGFTMIITGLWQIIKGARNTKLVRVAVAWYLIFFVVILGFQAAKLLGLLPK